MSPTVLHVRRLVGAALVAAVAVGCSDSDAIKQRYLANGKRLVAEKKYVEGILEFRNALRVDDMFAEARVQLAEAYLANGNPENAYREYQRAADLLPDDLKVQKRAATLQFMAGQFQDVRTRMQALLQKHPKDVEAQLLYANSLVGLNNLEDGIKQIEEAIALDPDHASTYINLALLKLKSGQRDEAAAAFAKAVELDPKSMKARLALIYFHLAAGELAQAEKMLSDSLSIDPKEPTINRTLAAVYIGTGRVPLAEAPLKLVADVTGTARAKFALADYYARSKRYKDARTVLEPLAADENTAADAQTRLAQLDYEQKDIPGAKKRLAAVLSRYPGHSVALQVRARWLLVDGQPKQALERANQAVAVAPRDARAIYLRGVLQAINGQRELAAKSFVDVLRLNPRAIAAQVQLAQLSLRGGDAEHAVSVAQEAVSNNPASPEGRLLLARALIAQGDLSRAESELVRLQKVYPNSVGVNAARGTLELLKGNHVAARTAFQAAFDTDPKSIAALSGLTILDVQQHKVHDARTRIEAQLRAAPSRYDILVLAGRVYVADRDLVRAEQVLRQATEMVPDLPEPYVILGDIYRDQNRLEQARAEFDAIAQRTPENISARTMAALLVHEQGKLAEAKKRYADILAVQSQALVAANNLAWIFADERENLDVALDLAERVTERIPEYAEGWDTLGWVYQRKQLPALAIVPFEKAAAKDPRNATFHLHLGMALAGAGDHVKARESLETALKLQPNFPDAQREIKALNQ